MSVTKVLPQELKKTKLMAEQWFFCFLQLMMSKEWYDESFHFDLACFLQYGPQDKLIVLPRSFLKTTVVSTYYSLWRSLKEPNRRTLITGNSSDNAGKTVHTIRGLVESHPLIQVLWPERIPRFDKVRWSDKCAELQRPQNYAEGTWESAGVGTNIIRRHFNCIIEDDTVAPKKDELTGDEAMPTRDDIEKAVGFHKLTIPLLVTFREDERIVVGTRWASYDLINYIYEKELIEKGGRFGVFDRPAYREVEGQRIPLYKRYSLADLDAIRVGMGMYMFNSLYLNMPLAKEHLKFNPDWFRYFDGDAPDGLTLTTVDPADPPNGKNDQCYTGIVTCRHTKQGIYVLGYVKGRFSEGQIIGKAIEQALHYGSYAVRLETDRYEHMKYAFEDELKRRRLDNPILGLSVEGRKTRGKNKDARILGLAPLVENGALFLRRGMRELEQEMVQYPNGTSVDLLDALAWQLPDHNTLFERLEEAVVDEERYHKFSQETVLDSILRGRRSGYGRNRVLEHCEVN